jgi:hypothetical protein
MSLISDVFHEIAVHLYINHKRIYYSMHLGIFSCKHPIVSIRNKAWGMSAACRQWRAWAAEPRNRWLLYGFFRPYEILSMDRGCHLFSKYTDQNTRYLWVPRVKGNSREALMSWSTTRIQNIYVYREILGPVISIS